MAKSRHTEAEMIASEDVAREVGISKPTIYVWKAKYGGMDVSQGASGVLRSTCLEVKTIYLQAPQEFSNVSGAGVVAPYGCLSHKELKLQLLLQSLRGLLLLTVAEPDLRRFLS
jgi:hypothetical protein